MGRKETGLTMALLATLPGLSVDDEPAPPSLKDGAFLPAAGPPFNPTVSPGAKLAARFLLDARVALEGVDVDVDDGPGVADEEVEVEAKVGCWDGMAADESDLRAGREGLTGDDMGKSGMLSFLDAVC